MLIIRSSFFYLGYVTSGILAGIIACSIGPFINLKTRLKLFSLWPKFTNWYLEITCNVRVVIEGRENIPNNSCVVVSNHQGQWETFSYQYLFYPLSTLLKQELLFIPFWGWGMWLLDPIAINRSKPKQALKKVLREGEKRLQKNIYVLFFPEGTRVPAGQIKNYARSGFELALRAKSKLLPIVHNSGDCWPAHKFIKKPGTIKLKIGLPIVVVDAKRSAKEVEEWTRVNLAEIRNKL